MDYFGFDLQLFAAGTLTTVDLTAAVYAADKTVVVLYKEAGVVKAKAAASAGDGERRIGTIASNGTITLDIKNMTTAAAREAEMAAIYDFCGVDDGKYTDGDRVSFKVADGQTIDGMVSNFFVENSNASTVRVCVYAGEGWVPTSIAIAADGTLTPGTGTESIQVAKGDAKIAATATTPTVFMNDLYNSTDGLKALYGKLYNALGDASITYTNAGTTPVAVSYQGADGVKEYGIANGTVQFTSNADATVTNNTLAITMPTGTVTISGAEVVSTAVGTVTSKVGGAALTVNKTGVITNIQDGADFTVALTTGNAATIGGKAYTESGSSTATLNVTKSGATETIKLSAGTITMSVADAAVVTDLGTVTNKAAKDLKVTSGGTVTSVADGAYEWAIAGGKDVSIGGKTYTNASPNVATKVKVVNTAGTESATLTDGYITMNVDGAKIVVQPGGSSEAAIIGTVTCGDTGKAITVSSDGTILDMVAGTAFTYSLNKGKTAVIGDASYLSARADANAVTMTVTAAGTAIALAANDVVTVNGESAVFTLTDTTKVQNKGTAALTIGAADASTLVAASGAVYEVVLASGKILTVGTNTYKENNTATATLNVDNGVVTLSAGRVEIAVSGTAVITDIGTITYTGTNTGDGITVTSAGVVSGDTTDGDSYTVVLDGGASYGTYKNASATETATFTVTRAAGATTTVLTAGSILLDQDNETFTVNGTTIKNTTGSDGYPITINTSGEVSQISAGAKFTTEYTTGTPATTQSFTYAMNGTTLAKTGDAVGVYTNAGAATVSNTGTVTGGTLKAVTLTLAAGNANVTAKGTNTTLYYALLPNGSVVATAATNLSDAKTAQATAIGFFKAVTSWATTEGATPTVTVTFVGNLTTEANEPKSYLGNVVVDATNVKTVAVGGLNPADLGTLVVTGISGAQVDDSDISVVGLNKNAEVSTSVGSITYLPDTPEEAFKLKFTTARAQAMNVTDASGTFLNYGVYAAIGEGDYGWYDTVADVKEAAETAGKSYVIGARYRNGVLTVANGGTGKKVTITEAPANVLAAADLAGMSVQVVESFDANGNATTGSGTGIVSFTAAAENGIEITTTLGESVKFENATLRAQIPAGATVVSGVATYTTDVASVMTLAAGGEATLDNGTVTVAKGKLLKVGVNEYTALETAAQITAAASEFNKDGTVKTAATIGTLVSSAIELNTAHSIQVVDSNENVMKIGTASHPAIVTSAGVVSGLQNGQTVSVTDLNAKGEEGVATKYTVDTAAKTITVSGKYVGVYSFASAEATTAATITSVYGQPDTITSVGAAVEPVALDYNGAATALVLESGANKDYYKVAADGTVSAGSDKATAESGGIGYFHVATATTGGKTTVTVTFHNNDGTKATLIPDVAVDFTAFQQASSKDVTTVDVSGLSNGVVSLLEVPPTAKGDIVGLKTGDAKVDYFATYALAANSTIALPTDAATAAAGTVWTYAISTSAKDDDGVRTYSIGTAVQTALAPVGPCFTVTKVVNVAGDKITYQVAYVAAGDNKDELDALDQACWKNGVTVDALGIAAITGKTVTVSVTPNQTPASATANYDKYIVNTQNGVIVDDVVNQYVGKTVTGKWTSSPATTITYEDTEGEAVQFITLPDTDNTYYWTVDKVNDGNNKITITDNGTTAPTSGVDYIKIVTSASGKTATVTYHGYNVGENNTPTISLSDLGVNVAIKAKSDKITTINITDGGKGQANCVDWAVTAYAGTTITGKGSGDADVTWIAKYKNAATINLDALAASTYEAGKTYYFAVTASAETDLDEEGFRKVTLASEIPSTEEPDSKTVNYFAVKKDKGGVYTVEYHTAAGDNAIALSKGKATLSVNGNETITSITEKVGGAVGDKYFVDQATDKLATLDEGAISKIADADYVEFVEVSRWTYNGMTEIDLSGWTGTPAAVVYNIKKTAGAIGTKGVTSYEINGATADGTLTFTYHAPTTTEDAYIEVTLAKGTLTKAEIEKIANAIKINAELNGAIADKVVKIKLTNDSDIAISYDITNLSGEIGLENFTEGKDTVTYAKSFVMGTDNTITLTAPAKDAQKAAVVYYAVTAKEGEKGVRTVSVSKTPIPIAADATPEQIAEALAAAGGNYFTVTTATDGEVTVEYTKNATASKAIDLTGKKVILDATAVECAATYKTPKTAVVVDGDAVAYTVSGLDVGQDTVITLGCTSTVTNSYNESFVVTYGTTATLDEDKRGTAIALTGATSGTYYYEVVRTEGSAATQGIVTFNVKDPTTGTAPASGHYFAVKYAATGATITYFNVDGSAKYNLADVMGKGQVTVSAAGVNEAITAINITDGGSADTPKVNYALTEVDPDIEVVGKGEGDTVTTKPSVVWADNQTLTLTDLGVAYYTLTGVLNETTGKVVVSISEGSATKPDETANYFVVKRVPATGVDLDDGKVEYSITEYHASNGGEAYDLTGDVAKVGTLTVDAAKATGAILLNNDDGAGNATKAHFAVINVPYADTAHTVGVAGDTIAYKTTFAWPTTTVPTSTAGTNVYEYTYLVAADSTGAFNLTPGVTATTSTEDTTTKYAWVTVTKDEKGNFELEVASNYTVDPATGEVDQNVAATSVTSIVAPSAACELNLAGDGLLVAPVTFVARTAKITPQITGVAAGAKVYLDDQDVDVVSGTLAAGEKITIHDADEGAAVNHVFTAAEAGAISVRHNGDAFTVNSGALLLSAGAANRLTSSVTAAAGILSYAELAKEGEADGVVVVTFDAKKGITSITGLDIGETVTVNEGTTADDVFTYARNSDGYVVKTQANDTSNKTYAAMDSSTIDILSLGYTKEQSITGVVGTFNWNNANATYYLAGDSASATVAYGTGTGDVTSGAVYVKAVFTAGVLTLTPMVGNSKGLLDPIEDYAGTITIKGDNHLVKFTKDAKATYTAVIDGVITGSEFKDLGANDTVTTEALAVDATIIMHVTQEDASVKDYTYKVDKAGALTFTGTALTSGTVEISNTANYTTVFASDGSKIEHDATASDVTVEVENGAIKSIKGLDTNGETVTVTKDGVTTTFAWATGGTVTKTVKNADGSTTITTIASVAAATDVWTAVGTNSITEGAFRWDPEGMAPAQKVTSGYFLVDANGKTEVVAGAGAAHNLANGEVFVKATVTEPATTAPNARTITLTPMIVKDGELVEATASEVSSKIKKVTVTGAPTVLNYDGTGKVFNIEVKAAGVGSTFTNLLGGDVVTSVALTEKQKITVNGQEWIAPAGGTTFTIYSESALASRIVAGAIDLTAKNATVNAAAADGSTMQTMTYTPGTDKGKNDDGVQVIYAAGVPTSITDLDLGESVKVEAVGADGKKVTTEYTTKKGTADGKTVIYRTRGGVVTVKEIGDGANVVDDNDPGTYAKVDTSALGAFDWTEAATKKTTVTGYFLASEKGVVEAATRTEELTTDYTQYGRTYLVATVTKDGGVQLQKATVGMTGKLGTPGAIAANDKLDVTLTLPTAGLKITSLSGRTADTTAIKSLTITNAAAGSVIGTWTANDHITTVSLAAGDTIKLGSTNVYTAGDAGVLELAGIDAATTAKTAYVKNGTIQLATGMKVISSSYTDATTEATTVDTVTYTPSGTKDTANITVTNGRVTGMKGFGVGETVVIKTTTTDKFGVATESNVTYTTEEITSGLDKGSILVTKTLDDNTSYTHVFKDTTEDVLKSSLTWNAVGQDVTKTNFNWNNTGYFHATLSSVEADAAKKIYVLDPGKPVKEQTDSTRPTFKEGDYYLQVVATKAMSGLVTISEMSFVQMQSNGSFAAVKGGETLPKFAVNATATGGITFAENAHPDAALTITPAMGKSYTGLADDDTIGTTTTAAGQTITVNGQDYTVTTASAFVINGDKTIESGTFTVTGTARASAVPQFDEDTVTREITYTPGEANKDGVAVTFTANAWGVGSEITGVTDLEAGETVVITNYIGSLDKINETTTITTDGAKITKTIHNDAWPTDVVMKKNGDETTEVTTMNGFQVANKFDFGTTTAGTIGFFKANALTAGVAAITTQAAAPAAFLADGTDWVIVGATTDETSKDVRIDFLKVVKDSGNLDAVKSSTLGGVTIDASKLAGGITLGANAVQLCTEYTKVVDPKTGAVTYEVDKANSDTKGREYGIVVGGALAGKAYNGFDKEDTIKAGALKADDTITVNGLTYAVKADAAADAVQFYGNGAALQGEFKFTSTYKEARGYAGTTLTTVTGAADATVTFAAGKLTSITEIAPSESITVTELDTETKATKVTTYVATANTDGTVKITRTIVADGVTTTDIGKSSGDLTNIIGLTYTDATASISSDFDWTVANGSGYFFADVTLEGSTIKDIGTVEIKPGQTTVTAADAGKYVAKVTVNSADGTVDKIRLHKVLETGELGDEINIPATATGTLNITGPTVNVKQADGTMALPALVFDKNGYAKLAVNITGATNGSVITNLAKGDKLATTTLKKYVPATKTTPAKAAEMVTINGTDFVAGADGKMMFVDAGVLTDGTIVMNGALTVYATGAAADKYLPENQVKIEHVGTDAPVVAVVNGVVTGYTDLVTGTVKTTVTATNASATYGAGSVTVALGSQKTSLTTLVMAEGDTVKFGTHTLFSGVAGNKLEFVRDTGTDVLAKNGVLRMTKAGDAFTAAGADSDASADNVTVTYNKKTTSSSIDVKVTNGLVTSIKGLKAGDELQVSKTGETTKYAVDATTPTKITKTVTKGTEVTKYTAFITEGADILAANYFGEGQDISDEQNQIVGQLNWADVTGRATGYFQINSKNAATIAEQSQKVTVTAAKGKTALWAVANAKTDDFGREALTIDALQVQTSEDGKTTTVLSDGAGLLAAATLTVTAPTGLPLFYNKTASYDTSSDAQKTKTKPGFKVVLNKVGAGSKIQNIALGDKVTTAALKAATATTPAESVQMVEANDGAVVTYTAGANGAMTFVGEGDGTAATPSGAARLLAGTVKLAAGESIHLAGDAEKNLAYSGEANDLTVTATGDNNVIVKAANGKVSTVTGLDENGASLEVTTGVGTSATSVKYTVVDVEYDTAGKKTTVMIERVEGKPGDYAEDAAKTYRTIKATADFYAGDQSKTFSPMQLETPTLTDWTAEGTKYAFINTTDVKTAGTYVFTTTAAKTAGVDSDVITAGFSATPNTRYYRLSAKTAKNGVTTITAVDAMEADATSKTGKLIVVKPVNGVSQVFGTVSIDGATASPANENNGKISFALPAYETKRFWSLDAKNLALGSVITGITKHDKVASGDGTYNLTSKDKTFTVYTNGTEVGTSTQVVTYAGKDGATAKVTAGVLSITNLNTEKEKVTVVTDLDTAGLVTTEYLALAGGLIQKTETAADGTKTVCTSKAAVTATDDVTKVEYGDPDLSKTTIVSDFNWTLDKSQVGYFAVNTSTNAAAVKTAKTTISTAAQKAATYIAVELDSENGVDGIVKSVKAMRFNATTGKMEEADENAFSGKITITAPTATALNFNRTAALATEKNSVGENAQIVITGAAANSIIANLKARATYATCDSVTTAKLAKGAAVSVGGHWYTAGAASALGFTMQQVNGADDERVTLTSGTIRLFAGAEEGPNAAIVGKVGVVANDEITVAASTKVSKGNATTSYTVGELDENESFLVKTYGDETITSTFKKSSSNLFYIADGAADDSTEGKYVYALAGKTSVASGVLAVNGKVPTAKGWKAVKETFTLGTDDFLTTTYGAVTVDLKTLDSRYAADKKKNVGQDTYEFVIDKYLAGDAKSTTKALNAAVVRTQDQSIQTLIGSVSGAAGVWHTYSATQTAWDVETQAWTAVIDNQVGQTIKATANWIVNGSNTADTIIGAASGEDFLDGGAGNDLLTGGAAKDGFQVGQGQDTIKSYATGKDTVWGAGAMTANLANASLQGADVLLWSDDSGDGSYGEGDNSVLLVGMANKKAVNIGGTNYFFGSGKAAKAETFTFDVSAEQADKAIYYGKAGLANTLSIGTDKTKATAKTLGDTLKVDLSNASNEDGVVRYYNIASADASKSGNRVDLTAAANGSTLKGGTYQSTLRGGAGSDMLYGGSGVDVFWAADLAGQDTVKSYQTSKDALFLGNIDTDPEAALEVNGMTLQVVGKNVQLTNGESGTMMVEGAAASSAKALKISKDGTNTNTLSYYFGTSAKKNAFTATLGTDMKSVTVDDVTNVTMSSYYLGSTAANIDTLTLKSTTKNQAIGKFDMNALSKYISTIDVIDTAGLAKGSSIELIGRESGTYTLKGSNNVSEKFNLKSLVEQGEGVTNNVTITNLGVGEIVELAAGMKCSMAASGKNTICTLTDDAGKSYGTLTITGVANTKLSYSSTTGQLTRTTK